MDILVFFLQRFLNHIPGKFCICPALLNVILSPEHKMYSVMCSISVGAPIVDPCYSIPCQHGGICTNLGENYACECTARYNGVQCEIDTGKSTGCHRAAIVLTLYTYNPIHLTLCSDVSMYFGGHC